MRTTLVGAPGAPDCLGSRDQRLAPPPRPQGLNCSRVLARRGVRHISGHPSPAPAPREAPANAQSPAAPGPVEAEAAPVAPGAAAMPLYEGLGSGGEKTAVVIDLGEAFTK